VHPGCGFVARHWPAERYGVVARELAGTGLPVVVTGNVDQRRLALQVAAEAGLPQRSVLAGHTGLSQLAALVADASLVVCGDTGIAHLATAYGTPSVVLFGPVSPRHWGPPPHRPQHVALWTGSTGDTFADRPDPGLLRITTGEVLAAAATARVSGGGLDRRARRDVRHRLPARDRGPTSAARAAAAASQQGLRGTWSAL
jgi:ADP-heptose:LPS heptosyltransferase